MKVISFNPKQVTKKLISVLPERSQDVVLRRFGLGKDSQRQTLEAIGETYGITRERVRQIENHALKSISKSEEYLKEQQAIKELENLVTSLGGIVSEEDLLSHVAKDEETQNHVHFILVVGHPFNKEKEDANFKHRWHIDKDLAEKVHKAIKKIYSNLSDEDLLSEKDIMDSFIGHLDEVSERFKSEEIIKRWLSISKGINKNPLGEWGKSESPNVRLKGVRDYAYLVLREHGSPMHFSEVAKRIEKVFGKKAHRATTHNELIKDGRFILVGRGLYALKEWGYKEGVVKEVIADILKNEGPLTKEEIIERVLTERYVKPNTVMVNLQDKNIFKKNKDNTYSLVK